MKKTILHIITDVGCGGGAERMLVTVIKELKEYDHIIVTLQQITEYDTYENELDGTYICLNTPSAYSFPLAAVKLRRIINKYRPDIVHSHLFWPTLIARIATPKRIPLITTIHAFVATSIEYKKKHIVWLDKISYHLRKSIIVTVAKGAQDEYFSFLKLKPYKTYVLYTFVDTHVFNKEHHTEKNSDGIFKMISVGSLKAQKNYIFLVEAFKLLKDAKVELHVYGKGALRNELQQILDENNITNLKLMGLVSNIEELIPQYDLFVMSSTYEGFSLAVLEAMSLKMPMLLSDISSFREQCAETAVYFRLDEHKDFVQKLTALAQDKARLQQLGNSARQRVLANFTLEHHMPLLRNIYAEALNNF